MTFGYRGYITSRPYAGLGNGRVPQHIQNLVVRDYCRRNELHFLLSVVEHTMPGCYMILQQLVNDLPQLDGCVLYSVFQLPESVEVRKKVYEKLLSSGKVLHTAVENICVKTQADMCLVEDIWQAHAVLNSCPNQIGEFCAGN